MLRIKIKTLQQSQKKAMAMSKLSIMTKLSFVFEQRF